MRTFETHEEVEGMWKCKKKAVVRAKQIMEPFQVKTLEGTMEGQAGDYLMRGVEGECYPCAKDIFEKTYEWV
jgi:hypothetical protein